MSETTWLRTLTRPAGHLLGTIATTAWAVVCAALAHFHPEWQPPLVLIGSTPLIIWTSVMSVIVHRQRSEQQDGNE